LIGIILDASDKNYDLLKLVLMILGIVSTLVSSLLLYLDVKHYDS